MTRENRISKQIVRQRQSEWLPEALKREMGLTMEFLNPPVTDHEVNDVICRFAFLPDPSGTNKDAAVLLERLCCELPEMRERASVRSSSLARSRTTEIVGRGLQGRSEVVVMKGAGQPLFSGVLIVRVMPQEVEDRA